jgi:WD40 repeat protein
LGDRCGSFQGKPDQTEQDKREERRANDRLPDLRRKWATAFRTYRQLEEVPAVGFSPDGTLRAVGSYDRFIKLWDVSRKTERKTLHGQTDRIYRISTSHVPRHPSGFGRGIR